MQDVRDSLRERINRLPWWHQIDFGQGLVSPGSCSLEGLRAMAEIYFRDGVQGQTVIDIGCWDGFNSFEAKRRGAARVLATDYVAWRKGWGKRECFDLARSHLAPDVDVMEIDVMDIAPSSVGIFDVVLFLGVLYHLRHPFLGIEKAASVCRRSLILETHLDAANEPRPVMVFYPTSELNNDETNWWGPNVACVIAMLRDVGFTRIDYTPTPNHPSRGIFHAYR
jgi:tRNA (mo5U34)-methyltransferase